ncbi:MAG: xylose isomerase [Opitutaceae bacterium]|nr:xylose isomerase [Opitutaceae bacterium]
MNASPSRRQFIATTGALATTAIIAGCSNNPTNSLNMKSFRYCLNTSTIREKNIGIEAEIDVATNAGYSGIEPWIRTIRAYMESGGKLSDLRKRLDDHGLQVESAIGFAKWIVDDPTERANALEEAKSDMEIVHALGGSRIAAPPAGAQNGPSIDLETVAERYHALLDVGRETGVVPMLEVWGHSQNLHRLGQTLFAAAESSHPDACMLLDIYHIYKGGSQYDGLSLLGPKAMPVLHMNDFPASPERTEMNDSHRVMPGDGIAPFDKIIRQLQAINPEMVFSLELFNRDYWKQDPLEVAKLGLEKMKAVVSSNL